MKTMRSIWNYIINDLDPVGVGFIFLSLFALVFPLLISLAPDQPHKIVQPHKTVQVYYDNGKREEYPGGDFDQKYQIIYTRNGTEIRPPKSAKIVVKYDK